MNEVNTMHELSSSEIDSVAGGMLPVIILGLSAVFLSGCFGSQGMAHNAASWGYKGGAGGGGGADAGVP